VAGLAPRRDADADLDLRAGKEVGKNVWHDPLRNVDMEWVTRSPSSALAERLAAILIAAPRRELTGASRPAGERVARRLEDAKNASWRQNGGSQAFGTRCRPGVRSLPGASNRKAAGNFQGGRYTRVRSEVEAFLARPEVRRAVERLPASSSHAGRFARRSGIDRRALSTSPRGVAASRSGLRPQDAVAGFVRLVQFIA